MPADYSETLEAPRNVAATYGSDAMYNVAMLPFRELGLEFSGKMRAFSTAVESLVLIPVMRNAHSVYTPMAVLNRDWAGLIAYRDPRLRETFEEVLPELDPALVKGAVAGAHFSELFFANCKDEAIAAYVRTLL